MSQDQHVLKFVEIKRSSERGAVYVTPCGKVFWFPKSRTNSVDYDRVEGVGVLTVRIPWWLMSLFKNTQEE